MKLAYILFALGMLACSSQTPDVSADVVPPLAAPSPEPKLAALNGDWLQSVALADGSEASVSVPLGTTTVRPIVVAAHGAGDRPEWACGEWRGVMLAYAFIVCPRGSSFGGAFAWASIEQLEARVALAEDAVRARFGAYVDPGPVILVGFSQGARLAAVVAAKHPARYGVVALVEGAWDESAAVAPAFGRGGRRVLLACSTFGCGPRFEAGRAALSRAKVDARLANLGNHGHQMGEVVTAKLRSEWRWLVRDDERWNEWLRS